MRNTELSEVDYAVCEKPSAKKGMRTLREVLVWYNNMDVVPFLGSPGKDEPVLARYGIDMLREAISLPGLAFKFEILLLKDQGLHLSSFHTEDLYQLFKNNMVGGPAIIFHHHAEKTRPRSARTNMARQLGPRKKSSATTPMPCICGH